MQADNKVAGLGGDFRLLVIDDDVIQRTIISKIGGQSGFSVSAAASFADAAQFLAEKLFDCVTLDLSLGQQSGAILLRTMVDKENWAPVIIVSGADEHIVRSTAEVAQSLGLECQILNKPLKIPELRQALAQRRQGAVAQRGLNELHRSVRKAPGA